MRRVVWTVASLVIGATVGWALGDDLHTAVAEVDVSHGEICIHWTSYEARVAHERARMREVADRAVDQHVVSVAYADPAWQRAADASEALSIRAFQENASTRVVDGAFPCVGIGFTHSSPAAARAGANALARAYVNVGDGRVSHDEIERDLETLARELDARRAEIEQVVAERDHAALVARADQLRDDAARLEKTMETTRATSRAPSASDRDAARARKQAATEARAEIGREMTQIAANLELLTESAQIRDERERVRQRGHRFRLERASGVDRPARVRAPASVPTSPSGSTRPMLGVVGALVGAVLATLAQTLHARARPRS